MMEWTNDVIFEFLTLYENEPALWNSSSPQHKNRNDVHDAWLRIKTNLKSGTIPIKELKKKKENLMSTYRKLKAKIKDTTKKGRGTDEPEWPFYDTMAKFMDDVYKPRTHVGMARREKQSAAQASTGAVQSGLACNNTGRGNPPLEGKLLHKKWKHCRDAFIRERRQLANVKSGSAATTSRKQYKYFDQLSFLLPDASTNTTDNSLEIEDNTDSVGRSSKEMTIPAEPAQKKKKNNPPEEMDSEIINAKKSTMLQKTQEEDPDRQFFLSLLSDFKRVPVRLMSMVKINILKAIMEAQDNMPNRHQTHQTVNHNRPYEGHFTGPNIRPDTRSESDYLYIQPSTSLMNRVQASTNPTSPVIPQDYRTIEEQAYLNSADSDHSSIVPATVIKMRSPTSSLSSTETEAKSQELYVDAEPSTSKRRFSSESVGSIVKRKRRSKIQPIGRRVVNINHFFTQLQEIANHWQKVVSSAKYKINCGISSTEMISEIREGLMSTYQFKCKLCDEIFEVSGDNSSDEIRTNVNFGAVAGALTAGIEYSQLTQITSGIGLPELTPEIFDDNKEIAKTISEIRALCDVDKAGTPGEESRIKVEIPVIDVIADGSW